MIGVPLSESAHTTQRRVLLTVVELEKPTGLVDTESTPSGEVLAKPYPPVRTCTITIPEGGGGGGGGGAPPIDRDTEATDAPTAIALLGDVHAVFGELRLAAVVG